MKVVCISGKAQHGKDTTAGMMKTVLEDMGYSVLIAHYGDLLKYSVQDLLQLERRKGRLRKKSAPKSRHRYHSHPAPKLLG